MVARLRPGIQRTSDSLSNLAHSFHEHWITRALLRLRHVRKGSAAINSVLIGSSAALGLPVLYLGGLTVGAAFGSVAAARRARATLTCRPLTKFLVLIPAHDEEAVIARLLQSTDNLSYPPDLIDLRVVADNCSDRTVEIAHEFGVAVMERVDIMSPGKGAALNWAVRAVSDEKPTYDAVVFIDADSVVDPSFLIAMDTRFRNGSAAVQGFYGVLDPDISAAVALRFAALACRHHLRPLGRTQFGASSGLYGNGMAFRRDLIESRQWSSHLIEDAEFQLELLLSGTLVHYEPAARLHAEMPDSFDRARTQHQRWEKGRIQVLRTHLPKLVRSSIRHSGGRVATIDAAFDLAVPPMSVLAGGVSGAAAVSALINLVAPSATRRFCTTCFLIMNAVVGAHVLVGLRLSHAPRSVYKSLASAPRLLIWKLRLLAQMGRNDRTVDWVRTQRNAAK